MAYHSYKNSSIRTQLYTILLFAFVIFSFICLLVYTNSKKLLLENADEYTSITSQKLENEFSYSYDRMVTFTQALQGDEKLQDLLSAPYAQKSLLVDDVVSSFASYKILDSSIIDITLVSDSTHYSTRYTYEEMDAFRKQISGNQLLWLGIYVSSLRSAPNTPMSLYGCNVYQNGENIGSVFISLDLLAMQIPNMQEMNSWFLLSDHEGVRFPLNCSEEMADTLFEIAHTDTRSRNYLTRIQPLPRMQCDLISAIDIRKATSSLNRIQILIWSCVIVVGGTILILFFLIIRNLVQPLNQFSTIIIGIRKDKKRTLKSNPNLSGCKEITLIGDEFTGMIQDIQDLNQKIFQSATNLYEIKLQKKEAELSYLRSQINPHFLYNSLEVLRRMALDHNAPEMAQFSVDMGQIFRYSTKGSVMVTLKDEIEIIKSYIRIQQYRFQGKFDVFYHIPTQTESIPVMKMLLQPLVENAIFHGLEPKIESGSLFIGSRVEDGYLFIMIQDDGIGISKEKLDSVNQILNSDFIDTSHHVGMANTHARLRLQYGGESGLSIESCEGNGTTIILKLPIDYTNKEIEHYV